eukprot:CAMPEP_0169478866 /NCGR_PEP_ID=MMETSP1042-20121227/28702_1 /TAXON_ID=464988 /ORGANISM="Hemiselmis andersenii, Strain CCMP1180" /LENGTH=200 /DNA_ID=CAMNT_0009593359 /DNA_START=68 /DNA_END=667 /DNA_ORIENTATION=-
MTKPCLALNSLSSGTRIIPTQSSVQISHSTPTGSNPASREKSTPASVCPSLATTPPLTALSGNTWPGRQKSPAVLLGSAIARNVAALSDALIPVVIPCFLSTDTVKAVHFASWLFCTIWGISSSSRRSPDRETQITPEVCLIMKAIVSGVAFSAAIIKSPSFSLPSSSTTTINSPRLTASMALTTLSFPKHHEVLRSAGV